MTLGPSTSAEALRAILWIPPFDSAVAYENEQWWDDARTSWRTRGPGAGGRHQWRASNSTRRPESSTTPRCGDRRGAPDQFIEVAIAARGRGGGTRVVRGLAERHPGRRLLAYSEGADGFWASLGWERFDHPEGRPEFHRALFIQAAR